MAINSSPSSGCALLSTAPPTPLQPYLANILPSTHCPAEASGLLSHCCKDELNLSNYNTSSTRQEARGDVFYDSVIVALKKNKKKHSTSLYMLLSIPCLTTFTKKIKPELSYFFLDMILSKISGYPSFFFESLLLGYLFTV